MTSALDAADWWLFFKQANFMYQLSDCTNKILSIVCETNLFLATGEMVKIIDNKY